MENGRLPHISVGTATLTACMAGLMLAWSRKATRESRRSFLVHRLFRTAPRPSERGAVRAVRWLRRRRARSELTQAQRLANGDSRLSLQERYRSLDGYRHAAWSAASQLVSQGYLLRSDQRAAVDSAASQEQQAGLTRGAVEGTLTPALSHFVGEGGTTSGLPGRARRAAGAAPPRARSAPAPRRCSASACGRLPPRAAARPAPAS
jgi:hypothetical protein